MNYFILRSSYKPRNFSKPTGWLSSDDALMWYCGVVCWFQCFGFAYHLLFYRETKYSFNLLTLVSNYEAFKQIMFMFNLYNYYKNGIVPKKM